MTNLHKILKIISLLILIDFSLSGSICRLQDGKNSECTRLHLCDTIWNYIKAIGNSSAALAYINDYQKCEEGRGFVCCPDQMKQDRPSTVVNDVKIPLRNNLNELSKHPQFSLINKIGCGLSVSNRCINSSATITSHPSIALLGYKDPFEENVSWKCGGSLINERYVLTASHCVLRSDKLTTIRLGEHNLLTKNDCEESEEEYSEEDPEYLDCADPVQDIQVESIIRHPDYSESTFANDIALVRLKKPANTRTNNVKSICLPSSEKITEKISNKFIIAGWGNTEFGRGRDVKMEANVPPISNTECQQNFTAAHKSVHIYDSMMCAGGTQDNLATCNGNRGDPIMSPSNVDGRPRYVQYGVTSSGIECIEENKPFFFPGVYTDLAYYMEWILDNMEP